MPTFTLQAGVPTVITQNVVYALPPHAVHLQSTAVVETSLDNSVWTAVAASTTGVTVAAVFVRCTTAAPTVSVKRLD